jgi:hypothetical protein
MDTKENLIKLKISLQNGLEMQERSIIDLLLSLEARDLIVLSLKQVRSYLPSYEKYYPQVTWPREWLEKAEKLNKFAIPKGFDAYNEVIADTGPLIFIRGIGSLNYAFNAYLKKEYAKSQSLACSGILAIVLAKNFTFWMEDDPEGWQLTRQEERNEKISRRIRKYKYGARYKNYEKNTWLDLLEDIAKTAG